MRVLLVFLTSAILQSVQLSAQAPEEKDDLKNPVAGKPEAIAAGRKLYLEGCSGCHGPTAEGGRGPNLAKGDQIRGATNRHLLSSLTTESRDRTCRLPGCPRTRSGNWRHICAISRRWRSTVRRRGMRRPAGRYFLVRRAARTATPSAAGAVFRVRICPTSRGAVRTCSCGNHYCIPMRRSRMAMAG